MMVLASVSLGGQELNAHCGVLEPCPRHAPIWECVRMESVRASPDLPAEIAPRNAMVERTIRALIMEHVNSTAAAFVMLASGGGTVLVSVRVGQAMSATAEESVTIRVVAPAGSGIAGKIAPWTARAVLQVSWTGNPCCFMFAQAMESAMHVLSVCVMRRGAVLLAPVDHSIGRGILSRDLSVPSSFVLDCMHSTDSETNASSSQSANASEPQGKSFAGKKTKRKVRRKEEVDHRVQDKIDPR